MFWIYHDYSMKSSLLSRAKKKNEIKLSLLGHAVFIKNSYKLLLVIWIWKLSYLLNIFAFCCLFLFSRKRDISIKNNEALAAFWLAEEKMIERKMYLGENSFTWKNEKGFHQKITNQQKWNKNTLYMVF